MDDTNIDTQSQKEVLKHSSRITLPAKGEEENQEAKTQSWRLSSNGMKAIIREELTKALAPSDEEIQRIYELILNDVSPHQIAVLTQPDFERFKQACTRIYETLENH